jgi:2-polyprenyl-3-methyl-5-hydroxy-6-metoxy-1,4-benzoquinol methylase
LETSTVKRYIAEVARRARSVGTEPPPPEPPPPPPVDDHRAGYLALAADHADIGTVVPADTRLRFLKRTFVRLSRHVTHHQVVFNRAILDAIAASPAAVPAPATPPAIAALEPGTAAILAALEVQVESLQDELAQLRASAAPGGHRFDEFYAAFEDRFRGSRERITGLMRDYVDELSAVATSVGGRVLDLGSGRGELLEVLRDGGVDAYGVDANEVSARHATERGLEVVVADALEHLRSLPDGELAAVTAMHVVEHLTTPALLALVDEAWRVLRPGGRIVLETPNPATWQVGANTFHLDPTHLRPLPSPLLEFMLGHRGFVDVETRPLHAFDDHRLGPPGTDVDPVVAEAVARLDDLRFGPHDYAALGTRPTDP